jgi:hypothetical protein
MLSGGVAGFEELFPVSDRDQLTCLARRCCRQRVSWSNMRGGASGHRFEGVHDDLVVIDSDIGLLEDGASSNWSGHSLWRSCRGRQFERLLLHIVHVREMLSLICRSMNPQFLSLGRGAR